MGKKPKSRLMACPKCGFEMSWYRGDDPKCPACDIEVPLMKFKPKRGGVTEPPVEVLLNDLYGTMDWTEKAIIELTFDGELHILRVQRNGADIQSWADYSVVGVLRAALTDWDRRLLEAEKQNVR